MKSLKCLKIIAGEFSEGDTIEVSEENGKLTFISSG